MAPRKQSRQKRASGKMNIQRFAFKFFAFYFGCFLCVYLQKEFSLSPVLSSALVGFVGTFYHFSKVVEKTGIHAVIYSGSFAGMCSSQNLPTYLHVFNISIIGTVFYFLLKPHLIGFGGKLGVIALLSSLVMVFSRGLL